MDRISFISSTKGRQKGLISHRVFFVGVCIELEKAHMVYKLQSLEQGFALGIPCHKPYISA